MPTILAEDFEDHRELMNYSGIYFLRIIDKEMIKLPDELQGLVQESGHSIIYIGKARDSVGDRLNQEIRGRGHGTFFRSLGAVLDHMSIVGCLVGRRTTNYVFDKSTKCQIVEWINKNIKVSWFPVDEGLDETEIEWIRHYRPLFNIQHNHEVSEYIRNRRRACIEFARRP